jgi:release factor glutamine methyltransferase
MIPSDLVLRLRSAGCVFAEEEAELLLAAAADPVELDILIERRRAGEPLEHLLGWVLFHGLRVRVAPGVFVPRRRTELLVRLAAEHARRQAAPVVLDLCCGCGALALALAHELVDRPAAELHAADVEPAAVAIARENLHGAATVVEGDLFAPLPARLRGRVDVLVANVPYVPTGAIASMPPEAREHEPLRSLDGGPDGLAVLRRVAAGAADWLAPGGRMFSETSADQAPAAVAVLAAAGLEPAVVQDDELDATAVTGTRLSRG